MAAVTIDIAFDFGTDATGRNPDPGGSSPTLLHYDHLLWSKPLPSGRHFELILRRQTPFALLHDSDLGKFLLTSDLVLATFTRRSDMEAIIGHLPPADIDERASISATLNDLWVAARSPPATTWRTLYVTSAKRPASPLARAAQTRTTKD